MTCVTNKLSPILAKNPLPFNGRGSPSSFYAASSSATPRRPIIYAGGGVTSSDTGPLLLQLAEKLGCPVTTTLMGLETFPPDHALALDVLGMHGTKYANIAINEADLVLAVGVRFDDCATGKISEFIKHGRIIHIDVDRSELNKNKPVTLPICRYTAANPARFEKLWR